MNAGLFELPNGWRYPLVGGTRGRHFAGTNFKPRKRLENAATPTSRVHAVLGVFWLRQTRRPQRAEWPMCPTSEHLARLRRARSEPARLSLVCRLA